MSDLHIPGRYKTLHDWAIEAPRPLVVRPSGAGNYNDDSRGKYGSVCDSCRQEQERLSSLEETTHREESRQIYDAWHSVAGPDHPMWEVILDTAYSDNVTYELQKVHLEVESEREEDQRQNSAECTSTEQQSDRAKSDWCQRDSRLADCIEELGATEYELKLQKIAGLARQERERKAAERLGMVHSCDWPDDVAELVVSLRSSSGVESIRSCSHADCQNPNGPCKQCVLPSA